MNPTQTFTKFLQHPPPRFKPSVQMVDSDANSILIQGDLPDCVQTAPATINKSPPPALLDWCPLQETLMCRANPNGISGSSDSIGHTDLSTEMVNGLLGDNQSISIHPGPISSGSEFVAPNGRGDRQTLDLLPSTEHPTRVTQLTMDAPKLESSVLIQNQRSRSCSYPRPSEQRPPVVSTINGSRRTESWQNLVSEPDSNIKESPGLMNGYSQNLNQDVTPGQLQKLQLSDSDGSPGIPNTIPDRNQEMMESKPVGNGEMSSHESLSLSNQHQLQMNLLLLRVNGLEDQLQRTRALLADRELLLASVRAESDVVERQAALKVKALECELAQERLRSAQDRWMVIQLRNQLTSRLTSIDTKASYSSPWTTPVVSANGLDSSCCPLRSAIMQPYSQTPYTTLDKQFPPPWPTASLGMREASSPTSQLEIQPDDPSMSAHNVDDSRAIYARTRHFVPNGFGSSLVDAFDGFE